MAIPPQFNNDLSLWFNDVVTKLNDKNNELLFIRRFWTSLTAAQKTAIKNSFNSVVDTAKTDLTSIEAEVATL